MAEFHNHLDEKYNNLNRFERVNQHLLSTLGSKDHPKGRLYNMLKLGNKSDVFIYYSGHGVPGLNDNKGYLLPVDADPSTVEINGYALDTLYKNLSKLPARSVTVALDACFSGSSAGGAVVKNASPALLRIKDANMLLKNGVILTASSNTEVSSWDKNAHLGLFTRYLAEGLSGKADKNHNGRVTLSELKHYLNKEVPYQARRRFNREQHPQVSGAETDVMSILQ